MMEEKINEMFVQIAKLPLLMQSASRFENCVQTLSHTVASYDAKITKIEQIDSSLAARVTILERNATSVSSGSGSARSWNILGHSDGSTATGSSGSMARGRLTTTGTQDVDSIPFPVQRMNMHEVPSYYDSLASNTTGITKWINTLWEESNMPADNRPVTIHCKAVSTSVRLVPFCSVKTTITVRQSKSIEEREIGKQFALLWRVG